MTLSNLRYCKIIENQKIKTTFLENHSYILRKLENSIKSILIHEYQRKSTRFDTNQHESTRVQHESERTNTSPTRVSTSLKQVQITKNRIKMSNQNPNVTYQWCFLEIYVEECICQGFKFFSTIYFQLYHQVFLYYKVLQYTIKCSIKYTIKYIVYRQVYHYKILKYTIKCCFIIKYCFIIL